MNENDYTEDFSLASTWISQTIMYLTKLTNLSLQINFPLKNSNIEEISKSLPFLT